MVVRRGCAAANVTARGFDLVRQADSIPGASGFYRERLRPRYHFTSRTGWLNDPNGLIWYRGEYHLFYQHNPTGLAWGNMTWGHAVSRDLVHWTEQPKVLFPDAATGTCFSGAAFIDHRNQLGRKTGQEEVIVAFYLRTEIGLCLAYSNDRGRTFTDYEGNPVLDHEGARIDTPRPFWHAPTGRWIAPTYDFFTNNRGELRRCVGFYSSENLTDWRFESRVEQDGWGDELCGCVDFFQLPLDGDPEHLRWVMIFIDGSYIVGDFDGRTFRTPSGKPAATDDRIRSLVIQGDYYATMTWHNLPDHRRVQIAWMRSQGSYPYPGMPFNQQMTVPSELSLHTTDDGARLRMMPAAELATLRTRTHQWSDVVLHEQENPLAAINADLLDLETEFEAAAGAEICVTVRGFRVVYDAAAASLSACGTVTDLRPLDGVVRLRILLDLHFDRGLRQRRTRVHSARRVSGRRQPLDRHDVPHGHRYRTLHSRPRNEVELGAALTRPPELRVSSRQRTGRARVRSALYSGTHPPTISYCLSPGHGRRPGRPRMA